MSRNELYQDKESGYFSSIRWDIISFIPDGDHSVLKIGCGNGNTLITLKELNKAREIVGIEINCDCLRGNYDQLDGFLVGDVEEIEPAFGEDHFDYIILGDVLEHLVDPAAVLKRYSSFLKSTGYIIASIPNIKPTFRSNTTNFKNNQQSQANLKLGYYIFKHLAKSF